MRFKIAIVGTGKKEAALETEEGQELIARLCEGPVATKEVSAELLEKFRAVRAIREEDGQSYLNFTCFTAGDIEILNKNSDALGRHLAHSILQKCDLSQPKGLSFEEVSWAKYLFFIVGCVCLDWYGMRILDEMKMIVSQEDIKKPGYGEYTLFANEDVPQNFERLYWGSHNWKYGSFWFTTFGDHAADRKAFPDISWRISFFSRDKIVSEISTEIVDAYIKKVAKTVVERSWDERDCKKVLVKLNYIQEDRLNVAVILKRDLAVIKTLLENATEVLADWLRLYAPEMKERFSDLTSVRAGVDFKEVLLQVWHYVFGHTNKHLAEDERFFDPYSDESSFKGYLPVIHESGCFF